MLAQQGITDDARSLVSIIKRVIVADKDGFQPAGPKKRSRRFHPSFGGRSPAPLAALPVLQPVPAFGFRGRNEDRDIEAVFEARISLNRPARDRIFARRPIETDIQVFALLGDDVQDRLALPKKDEPLCGLEELGVLREGLGIGIEIRWPKAIMALPAHSAGQVRKGRRQGPGGLLEKIPSIHYFSELFPRDNIS